MANGSPQFFCLRNSNSGEIVEVSRDTSGAAGKKKVARNESATAYQGWISTQIGEQLFQVREGNAQGCRWVTQ